MITLDIIIAIIIGVFIAFGIGVICGRLWEITRSEEKQEEKK